MRRKNQYLSREATLAGWSKFSLEGVSSSNIEEVKDWLEANIEGKWAVAGFGGNTKVTFRFENVEDGVYARMVW